LTIADGKRGDVPVTAVAYAQALVGETPTPWGAVPGLGADAFTANPLLGRDALEPLVAAAEAAGAGVFVLVRTSNAGAADLQDLPAPQQPLHERLAGLVEELDDRLLGPSSGLSGMGAVVGATEPEHISRLRALMPRSLFLIPGVGAQGGRPELLGAAFAAGPASALIAASRGIAADPDPAAAAERLRATVWGASTA
jgi:orotidine-5'-phosphate decarboxylase